MNTREGGAVEVDELMMFYNAENFFAPDFVMNNPAKALASGLRKWDDKKFTNKLFKIAHVFELVKEEHAVLPMLIGLAEIQGGTVLEKLTESEVFQGNYDFVHYESMDERGVDVALLYDRNKIEIVDSQPLSYFFEIDDRDPENYDTTRDVLWVKAVYEGFLMNVFVLHLPSKRERDVNKPKRTYIINDLREKISKIVSKNEAVVLMGDFNENPDEENLQNLTYVSNFNAVLYNPFEDIFKNKIFSTFHYHNGLLFDQILLSADFYKQDNKLEFRDAQVFTHQKLSNWGRKFSGRPFRTYAGTRYLGGYSDHFPVLIRLKRN